MSEDWTARSACRGVDPATGRQYHPDLWHPVGNGVAAEVRAAKAVCASCPVRKQCSDQAFSDRTLSGIWGGWTWDERKKIRKRVAV